MFHQWSIFFRNRFDTDPLSHILKNTFCLSSLSHFLVLYVFNYLFCYGSHGKMLNTKKMGGFCHTNGHGGGSIT